MPVYLVAVAKYKANFLATILSILQPNTASVQL